MKNPGFIFLALVLVVNNVFAGGGGQGSPASVQGTDNDGDAGIESALKNAVEALADNIPANSTIAVVHFSSGDSEMSQYVLDEIAFHLANTGRFRVVDGNEINRLKRELNFQMSGEMDDNSLLSIGRMIGANIVINGNLTGSGATQYLRLNAINTETTQILAMVSESFGSSNIPSLPARSESSTPAYTPPPVVTSQQPTVVINNTSGLVMVPSTGQKKALVIGNSNYQYFTRLTNPSNDAKDIAAALRAVNYTVFPVFDGDLQTMEEQISNFSKSITIGDTVLVFYAGHGVQNGGENYLLPVDQSIKTNAELRRKAFSLQEISDNLERSPAARSIIILDACRNSPLPDRGAERGLSVITKQPHESVVIFSTAPNTIAQDGTGRNSPFTEALKGLIHENAPIIQLMPKLTQKVHSITGNEQTPWVNSNASNLFSFSGDVFIMQ
jgi:hypothetical protein